MQWKVLINGKEKLVSMPDTMPDNTMFEAVIDGRPVKLRWQRTTKSLYILVPNTNAVWSCVNTRSINTSKFPGESELNVTGEFVPPGARTSVSLESSVSMHIPGQESRVAAASKKPRLLRSQITGKVLRVMAKPGSPVTAGDVLMIIEAMKMENRVLANAPGVVEQVKVAEGDTVAAGSELIRFKQG